ncbi:glycine zipper 2TM domain-containing protein [Candidatus Dependentiae bacterium]|jgi:hypothetical protein|nr:glycine zipper 2TM domain-containing protein [Candidatus Dependentiae bacterium]
MHAKYNAVLPLIMVTFLGSLVSGCGKHEGSAGAVGAGAGALIGNAVAGRNDKGTGTLVGALIGNVFGREVGRAADKEEEQEQRARNAQRAKRMFAELQAENQNLRENLKKWCFSCQKKINILGAQSCPSCGDDLGREKFCRSCATSFTPDSSYRYCPYCRGKVLLSSR